MREILFRGKRKDNGKWVEGAFLHLNVGRDFICDGTVWIGTLQPVKYEVDPETVGQYTGIIDKVGNRVFEGDLVQRGRKTPGYDPEIEVGVIAFEDGCFVIKDIYSADGYNELSCVYNEIRTSDGYMDDVLFEVSGTIYDIPDLTKEAAQ